MAKKKNPAINLRASDIRRMKKKTTDDAVKKSFVIMFTVLHDKWGFDQEQLAKLLEQTVKLSEMIDQKPHYVTLEQLEKVLSEELNIHFKKEGKESDE